MREIKTKTFILVDDELGRYADRFKRTFDRMGVAVEVALGYHDAVDKMSKTKFGLAIIDINLGDYLPDGLELVKKIRETDNDMVIYILTGYGPEREKEALGLGADKFLLKPLNFQEHILKPMGVVK